jgi:hypothetical protein
MAKDSNRAMDNEAVFELFRTRCVKNIMQSLDKSMHEEQRMFRQALAFLFSCNLSAKEDNHKRMAVASIYKYFLLGDSFCNPGPLKGVIQDLKSNCEQISTKGRNAAPPIHHSGPPGRQTQSEPQRTARNTTNTRHA